MPRPIPVFNGLDETDRQHLTQAILDSYSKASESAPTVANDEEESPEDQIGPTYEEPIEIPEYPRLIGLDPSVFRQINAALQSGKQHLLLYGPPGTGKTELARWIASNLHERWCMITGSADWTSQDVIGGYQPVGDGEIQFVPGVLLQNFDRPLIIDELNRCDIDKAIGALFSVLSGQPTTLPYRMDVRDKDSLAYTILPQPKGDAAPNEFAPKKGWRIIATINSIDKAALYQMSFALTRRFGWILVEAPRDHQAFLLEYLRRQNIISQEATPTEEMPLATIWSGVNSVRPIGAAPIIDLIHSARIIDDTIDFLTKPSPTQRDAYIDGFSMYLLPMLDGILHQQAEIVANSVTNALGLSEDSPETSVIKQRLFELAV